MISLRKFRAAFPWLLALLLVVSGISPAPVLQAQVLYGSIVGDIQDQSGAAVPNATVVAVNTGTGLTRETKSDEAGRYVLGDLLPGTYDLKITSSGFRTTAHTGVLVSINTVSRVDSRLEVGQLSEQVTVEASSVLLQTDKSDTHTDLNTKIVTDMPLNVYRNYQALINLVPGSTPASFQNSSTDSPGRSLRTNINGTAANNNNTRLDGAQNVNIWLPHHAAYVTPSETVETVNISTSAFDAEQGMAGGSAITVVTKSGTNQLHGSAFEYHNNQHMRARDFFLPPTSAIPRDTLNIFGGTVGGPVIKNKLFFFGSYEATRQRIGGSSLFSVPTAAMRTGDFSAISTVLYDPATGNPDGTGRSPFPGNVIPANRLSGVSQKILQGVPLPNQNGTQNGTVNNFFKGATGKFDRDNYDIKINYNRNERHAIWGKYSVLNANVGGVFAFGNGSDPGAGGPGVGGDPANGHTFIQIPTIGHTYTISPTLLLDQTLGFTRTSQNVIGSDYGKNYGTDVYGIPGTNGPDIRQSGLPIVVFSSGGYTNYGQVNTWIPLFRADQSYTNSNNISWTHGAHELRFGFDLVRHQLNHWQPEIGGGPRGQFTITGGVTSLAGGAAPNQYNEYAAFLLGLPTQIDKSLQYLTMSGREWQFGYFVRDRWQVSRNLTVNLGLRLEHYPLMRRASSGIERLDLSTMKLYLGGRGSTPDDAGISTNSLIWLPRVGIAYRMGNTVIRTGYGMSADPLPFSRPLRGHYPYTINGSFPSANSYTPVASLSQGIPFFTGPDVSSGVVDLPPNVDERSPYSYIHRGYIQSWNFSIERRLPLNMSLSAAYVGTESTHMSADLDVNAAAIGAGANGRPLYAQFKRNIALNIWDGYLSSNYHSLQTSLNKQYSHGLMIKAAYTWAKAINMTDDDGWTSVLYNHPSVFYRNRAVAGYDRTHVFQAGYVLELPFGRGKSLVNHGPLSYIIGNWQTNGVLSAYTGRPFTVTASGASLNAPGNQQTADQLTGTVTYLGGVGPGNPYYDPAAFAPVTAVRYGSTGRNYLRGPGVFNLDASLFRTFPIGERFKLEFKGEAFNLTNTPKFANPNANVSAGNFMVITSTIASSNDAVYAYRQLRVALRLSF